MVLGLSKFPSRRGVPEGRGVLVALLAVSLFLGCVDAERSNPYDENGNNFNPSLLGWVSSSSALVYALSSSSVEPGYSSPAPSSGSQEPSSGSREPSSGSREPSSSSVVPSSSSALPSSSSVASSSSSQVPSSSSSVPLPSSSSIAPSSSSIVSGGKGNSISSYRTVVIGTQTWMAENFDYAVEGSKCYNNQESYCNTYGRLYDWSTAMDLPSSCNSNACSGQIQYKHKGICPSGWHIPSQAEWNTLSSYVQSTSGCSSCDARLLKATSGWSSNGNSTDDYGFSALPGGGGLSDGSFSIVGGSGRWWSASEYDSYDAYYRDVYYDSENALWSNDLKSNLFSVRCLQD